MGDRTKIDWCDASWNPVTGCLHGCEYCYARRMIDRFKMSSKDMGERYSTIGKNQDIFRSPRTGDALVVLKEPYQSGLIGDQTGKLKTEPYPAGFNPTLHLYRLDIPRRWKRPRTIFVCSMADLFGEWVPDDWIIDVLNACRLAPQHRYLFLTKNPDRYDELEDKDIITDKDTNFWLGSTVTVETRDKLHYNKALHTFQSCEPMLAPWPQAGTPNPVSMQEGYMPEWVIFGAETGNRKDKVVPEKAWVDNAVQMCRNMKAKVFMKESLRGIMGADFVQEFPWEIN